jgi:hypothetical protein
MSRPSGQQTDIAPVEEWEYDLLMPHLSWDRVLLG